MGEQPLMDELEVEYEMAEKMVDVCTEEAKIVVKEQEAKKKAEAAAKAAGLQGAQGARNALLGNLPPGATAGVAENPLLAAAAGASVGDRGIDAVAGNPTPPLGSTPAPEPESESGQAGNPDDDDRDAAEHTLGPTEHAEGYAPEIVTHDEHAAVGVEDELSPEERAIHGPDGEPLTDDDAADPASKEFADEQSEEAALAEGRLEPPAP